MSRDRGATDDVAASRKAAVEDDAPPHAIPRRDQRSSVEALWRRLLGRASRVGVGAEHAAVAVLGFDQLATARTAVKALAGVLGHLHQRARGAKRASDRRLALHRHRLIVSCRRAHHRECSRIRRRPLQENAVRANPNLKRASRESRPPEGPERLNPPAGRSGSAAARSSSSRRRCRRRRARTPVDRRRAAASSR